MWPRRRARRIFSLPPHSMGYFIKIKFMQTWFHSTIVFWDFYFQIHQRQVFRVIRVWAKTRNRRNCKSQWKILSILHLQMASVKCFATHESDLRIDVLRSLGLLSFSVESPVPGFLAVLPRLVQRTRCLHAFPLASWWGAKWFVCW